MTPAETRPGVASPPDPWAEQSDLEYVTRVSRDWANRHPVGSYLRDEVLSAANLGHALALKSWTGKAPFRHYLASRVKGEMLHALKKDLMAPGGVREWGKQSFRDEPKGKDAGFAELNPYEDGYLAVREPSHEEGTVGTLAFQEIITGLPERWKLAVELRYLEDMELKDIGKELGISGPRVHQILEKALKQLRESYEEEAA